MRPAEMLDHKADLLTRVQDPNVKRAWIKQSSAETRGVTEEEAMASGAQSVMAMTIAAREAECYHVTEDMSVLLQFAATQLNGLDQINTNLAPTRFGLVRFEKPLGFQDVRGRMLKINWLLWGPVLVHRYPQHDAGEPEWAMCTWLFNDHRTDPDIIYTSIIDSYTPEDFEVIDRRLGRWGYIGAEVLTDGERLGPAMRTTSAEKIAEILGDGMVPTEFGNAHRLVHAFWLLVNQTVTVATPADVDRATRKRMGRMNLPARVTIIRLRRTETRQSEGESLVEWSHRWVTRGHWRNQHVSSGHPLAQQMPNGGYIARLWIGPHVKGPKNKPLIISEKVYAVNR